VVILNTAVVIRQDAPYADRAGIARVGRFCKNARDFRDHEISGGTFPAVLSRLSSRAFVIMTHSDP
jgi:hypothetical protein